MIKLLSATAMIAALGLAPALAASTYDSYGKTTHHMRHHRHENRAYTNGGGYDNGGYNNGGYNAGGDNGAYNGGSYGGPDERYLVFNRLGCPPGSTVQSFPNQNGQRCALPNGGYSY